MKLHTAHTPNFDARPNGQKPLQIIVHYTSMAGPDEVLACFADPAKKVSSHYYILECGKVYQLVDDHNRSWHAGKSQWRGQIDLNDTSIGIELDNRGHNRGYTEYPKAQIDSFIWLARQLQRRHGIQPEDVLGHSDVAPDRKADPGEKFPWERLAALGIGVWPDQESCLSKPRTIAEAQKMLADVGYDCPQTGTADTQTQHVLTAFKRHYATANLKCSDLLPELTQRQLAGMPHLRIVPQPVQRPTAARSQSTIPVMA